MKLAEELIVRRLLPLLAESFDHLGQVKTAFRHSSPLCGWKESDPVQIFPSQLNLEPLSVIRQFAPHRASAQEKEGAPQGILSITLEIGLIHEVLELVAIFFEFRVMKLAAQELCDHLVLAHRACNR